MVVGFRYATMTVTGALHLTIGIICFLISIVGFSVNSYRRNYSYRNEYGPYVLPTKYTAIGSFLASLWIITVGIVGIITGRDTNSEAKTRKMKTAYLTLAILSASLFSTGGMSTLIAHAAFAEKSTDEYMTALFCFGAYLMLLELVLAIVTSCMCCCCSNRKNNDDTIQGQETLHQQTGYTSNVGPYIPPQYTTHPPNVTGPYIPLQYTTHPPNVTGVYIPPQYPSYPPNVAGAQMPSQNIANVPGASMVSQYPAYPANATAAQMSPQCSASSSNVAE